MKKWSVFTIYVTVIAVAAIIVWDFVAISNGGTQASISHLIKVWGHKYPIIPFSMGVLCGHFFWGVKQTKALERIGKMVKDLDKE